MRFTTWLLRRLCEALLFVSVTVAAGGPGGWTSLFHNDPAVTFVAYWVFYYAVFSGYILVSLIVFSYFKYSRSSFPEEIADSLVLVLHSYGAVSVMHHWPVGLGAGVDGRSPPILGWMAVLALHAVLIAYVLLRRWRTRRG
jgi:amino acid transporter